MRDTVLRLLLVVGVVGQGVIVQVGGGTLLLVSNILLHHGINPVSNPVPNILLNHGAQGALLMLSEELGGRPVGGGEELGAWRLQEKRWCGCAPPGLASGCCHRCSPPRIHRLVSSSRSSLCIAPVQWWQVVAAIFDKIENSDDRAQVEGQIDTHLIIDWVPCS